MTLTAAQFKWLQWLASNGGEATIQGNHVVCLATSQKAPTASAISFLHLLSKGALFVRGGRIAVSDYGQRLIKP